LSERRSKLVCPSCGREVGKEASVAGLCPDCYVERYGVARLPGAVKYVFCVECGSYRYQGGWNEGLGDPEETMKEYLRITLTSKLKPSEGVDEAWVEDVELSRPFEGPGVYEAYVDVRGLARQGKVELRDRAVVRVEAQASVCPVCSSRLTGRGYEAEIKVRGARGPLSEEARRQVERIIRSVAERGVGRYVVKLEEEDGGINVYLADQQAARMLASKLKAALAGEVIESFKLVGRKPSGKRKGRLTISVRVPDFKPGDVIMVEGKPHLFLSLTRSGILAVDLRSGREVTIKIGGKGGVSVKDVELYQGGPEMRRYMLLSRDGPTTVFLDADKDYQDVVEVPSDRVKVYVSEFKPGETYIVFRVANKIYVIKREESGGENG
jgi:nonsense-mediated mRNA decay protein 3